MADLVCNIAKGRAVELVNRVRSNDPSTSAIIVIPLAAAGLEADDVLRDADTFAALVAGATNEATNTGLGRKVLTDAELAAYALILDDTANTYAADAPDLVWATVANDGTGPVAKLVFCYDADTGTGTDANLTPISVHDFVVTPNGGQITAQINAGGFVRGA